MSNLINTDKALFEVREARTLLAAARNRTDVADLNNRPKWEASLNLEKLNHRAVGGWSHTLNMALALAFTEPSRLNPMLDDVDRALAARETELARELLVAAASVAKL